MRFTDRIRPKGAIVRGKLKTLQANMGDLCNQCCTHCHIGAGPQGKKIMGKKVIDDILLFLSKDRSLALDITGGSPEMNPNFRELVSKAKRIIDDISVRTNLTVILEDGMEEIPRFYKRYKVRLIGSLPCYTKENVNRQRGDGTFSKSIEALKELNRIGYGKEDGLKLDLTFNPGGAFISPEQKKLESDYRKNLYEQFGLLFNNLITITNAPINRFREFLEREGKYADYMRLLEDSFNEGTLDAIMCTDLVSVGWDGALYDCDFNQALCLPLRDADCRRLEIGRISPADLENRRITFDDHCFACTAGYGSSCRGALA